MELSISKTQQDLSGCTGLCRKTSISFSFSKVTFSSKYITLYLGGFATLPKGMSDKGHCALLGFCAGPQRYCLLCFFGAGLRRGWKQRPSLGPNDLHCCVFLVAPGEGEGGCSLSSPRSQPALEDRLPPTTTPSAGSERRFCIQIGRDPCSIAGG